MSAAGTRINRSECPYAPLLAKSIDLDDVHKIIAHLHSPHQTS
jgi:hypothetical protein